MPLTNCMNKKEAVPIIAVSLLLLFYSVLVLFQIWLPVVYFIYTISFILVGWLVYSVVRFGEYKGRELEKEEEWGYADTDKPHSVVRDDK